MVKCVSIRLKIINIVMTYLRRGLLLAYLFLFFSCALPPSDNTPRFLDPDEFKEISDLTYAKDLTNAGQLAKAERILWRAIQRSPDLIVPKNDLGYLFLLEERYSEAEDILKQALSIEESFVSARLNLARVYIYTSRFEEALREYETVEHLIFKLKPREYERINREPLPVTLHANVKRLKASTYYLMGIYDEAVCNSSLAQNLAATIPEASLHTRLLLSLEKLSIAHEALRGALIVHQEFLPPDMLFDYGLVLTALESYDTAKLVFDRILELPSIGVENRTASRFLRYALEKNPDEAELLKESLLDDALSPCKRKKFDSAGYWPHHAKELIVSAYKEVCLSDAEQ
jgi:tetratricopeptide (TPR) repeat protein